MAAPRTSANYSIPTETLAGSGGRAASANYANVGTVTPIAGESSHVPSTTVAKHGFIPQLADVVGLQISAPALTLNEGGTLQLSAKDLLDDATTVALSPSAVNWSVISGPVTSISASGLAAATGAVFENSPASIGGTRLGNSASLNLTVQNVGTDDFGTYAGDALDDAWQVQYFGLDNPDAAPAVDPDGDGQNNAFEFAAGVIPNDAGSLLNLRIEPVFGEPDQRRVVFSPRFGDRTYEVEFQTELGNPVWNPLIGGTQTDVGLERSVTDSDPVATKYYRVRVTRP